MKDKKFKKGQKVLVKCDFAETAYLLEAVIKDMEDYNKYLKQYDWYTVQIGSSVIRICRRYVFKDERDFLEDRICTYKYRFDEAKQKIKTYKGFLKKKHKGRYWLSD